MIDELITRTLKEVDEEEGGSPAAADARLERLLVARQAGAQ